MAKPGARRNHDPHGFYCILKDLGRIVGFEDESGAIAGRRQSLSEKAVCEYRVPS